MSCYHFSIIGRLSNNDGDDNGDGNGDKNGKKSNRFI